MRKNHFSPGAREIDPARGEIRPQPLKRRHDMDAVRQTSRDLRLVDRFASGEQQRLGDADRGRQVVLGAPDGLVARRVEQLDCLSGPRQCAPPVDDR